MMSRGTIWSKWWDSKSAVPRDPVGEAPACTDIASLNCLTEDVSIKPSYTPKLEHRRIDFYYVDDDQVVIAGMSDNNFVFWLSRTDLSDKETNRAIFDYIAQAEPTVFGDISTLARKLGYGYEELCCFYRDSITYVGDQGGALENMLWRTPFGVYYARGQEQNNGLFFAQELQTHRNKLKRRCRFREADGRYLEIMRGYLGILEGGSGDPVKDYDDDHELIDLIHQERYLLCSDTEAVREVYLKLTRRCAQMYNAYMSIVR